MNENVKWKVDGIFKADANECYREISSLEQIVNIVNLAGFGNGIGSGRSSGYGRYHVDGIK